MKWTVYLSKAVYKSQAAAVATLPEIVTLPNHTGYALTMSECLLAERRPVPYPEPRPPIAPLWEGPMIPCMSPWPPGIAVDGPTAWFRRTWIASSSLSKRSSIRLCCWLRNVKCDLVQNAYASYRSKTLVDTNHTLGFWLYVSNQVYFLKTIIKIVSFLENWWKTLMLKL